MNDENYGGYSDWRVPTLGEVEDALANGLNSHLDFFLDGSPDDGVYRWTSCETKIRGVIYGYKIRFTDGDVQTQAFGGPFVICVRGQPADPTNDCPGKKKGKDKNAMLLPRSTTGAILLLPVALVLGCGCVSRRKV